MTNQQAVVAIFMGSRSDWDIMGEAAKVLQEFGLGYDVQALSAHRTPKEVTEYIEHSKKNGIKVIIAGAGAAAHLPGVLAAQTTLPVLGVPIAATSLGGMDALLAIAQMPGGIPVGSLAIGKAGAKNAGLMAISILALSDNTIDDKLLAYRQKQTENVITQNAALRAEIGLG